MKWRAVGFLVVVVFAVGLAVYDYWADHRYRIRHSGPGPAMPVLVANQLIPKGTSGSLVLSKSMYAPTTLPPRQVEAGAISDPTYLRGRASAVDIFPGQQFTETDFTASDVGRGRRPDTDEGRQRVTTFGRKRDSIARFRVAEFKA